VEQLVVQLGSRSYPIAIGPGAIEDRALLEAHVKARQLLVVTNEVVAPLYLEKLLAKLPCEAASLVLPDGERHKTLATFERIIDRLIELQFHRDACLVALGGGVIGDVAGFAAACYQRGVDFVQVPTTLLAQVDSAVGGKTAVNHRLAKNMIGAFHQPVVVISDTRTLQTLPSREFSAGLAEVIKHGLIIDSAFFGWLEEHMDELLALDDAALAYAIRRCCEIKASIVAEDEFEHGRRALLNLGHTFGHALEALGEYGRWLHGEAVAVGISIAAATSVRLGTLTASDCQRIDALLLRARLPIAAQNVDIDQMLSLMALDKKAKQGGLKLVLLSRIGEASLASAPDASFLRRVLSDKLAS
jgi:3-dehydroquinate synthase